MYLFHFVLHLFQVLFNVFFLSWELLKERKHPDIRWTAICNDVFCVVFFFLFHTFLLTLTFISLIWGFLSYHCLLPLLVAFWDLGAAMGVGGKEIQCYSHNCSAPRSGMPRTVPPPQHRGIGSWLQWGEHLLLQTPQPSSLGSSGCSPMNESKRSC